MHFHEESKETAMQSYGKSKIKEINKNHAFLTMLQLKNKKTQKKINNIKFC